MAAKAKVTVTGNEVVETSVPAETKGAGTDNPLLTASILHDPGKTVEVKSATEMYAAARGNHNETVTSADTDLADSGDKKLAEEMEPYVKAFPGVGRFYRTTDGQVFTEEHKNEAFDHQKHLESNDKVTVYKVK